MALEQSNFFALLGGDDCEDVSKLIKRAVSRATTQVAEKKKRQPQAVKKEQTQLSPEMLKAKPIVLPDYIKRRDLVLRKPKAKGEGWANGYGRSYGMGNGYGYHGNYGVSTGSEGNSIAKKGNKRNGGDNSSAKPVGEDGWQVCTGGSRHGGGGGGSRKVLNDYDGSGNESQATMGTQQIEEQEEYGVKKSGEVGAKSKKMKLKAKENPKEKAEERTPEYEQAVEEYEKALEALKESKQKKANLEKKFEAQQIAEKKKEERLASKKKSKKDKPKKKDENKEKVRKPLSTNVFSKPVKKSSEGGRRRGFFKSKLGKGIIWVSALTVLLSILLDTVY